MRVSSATRMQTVIRKMLMKRASKAVLSANQRQTNLDQREKSVAISEAKVKEDRQSIGSLQIKLSVQESTNERNARIVSTKEASLVRRQEELIHSEKRQQTLQIEVEQRHVDTIKRETELVELRSICFEREQAVDGRKTELELLQATVTHQQIQVEGEKNTMAQEYRLLETTKVTVAKEQKVLAEQRNDFDLKAQKATRQEERICVDIQQIEHKETEVRAARLENEVHSTQVLQEREELYRHEDDLRKREVALQQREKIAFVRENEMKELGPRETAVQLRETQQKVREHSFYENTAAKVHSKQKEQIRNLEECLEEEIHANQKLQGLVEELREASGGARSEHRERGVGGVARREGGVEEDLAETVPNGVTAATDDGRARSSKTAGDPTKIMEEEEAMFGETDDDANTENKANTLKNGGSSPSSFGVAPSANSVGRLNRARSMICHLIEDDGNAADVAAGTAATTPTQKHPTQLKEAAVSKQSQLNVRAAGRFRKSVGILERSTKTAVLPVVVALEYLVSCSGWSSRAGSLLATVSASDHDLRRVFDSIVGVHMGGM